MVNGLFEALKLKLMQPGALDQIVVLTTPYPETTQFDHQHLGDLFAERLQSQGYKLTNFAGGVKDGKIVFGFIVERAP